jgi:alanyl-tRNA synthetase
MTIRHYYHDATTTQFSATVLETRDHDGRPAVVLDHTYFYPTSGGQPHDTGTIQGGTSVARVIEVLTAAPDAPVIHVLDRPWAGERQIRAEIDWARRFDHMQQHTGQHILSQAFIRVAEAETVGFHLSDQTVTIDLDVAALESDLIDRVEQLANAIVWSNLPVAVQTVSPEEAQSLALRKLPPKHDGRIRLIAIGDFDLTACGGTHVAATGQVGVIKLVKTERRGETTRVEFRCGARALEDYRRKHGVVTDLSATLTTGLDDLTAAVARTQDDARLWRTMATRLQKELTEHEAEALWQAASPEDGQRVVVSVFPDGDAAALRTLANRLMERERTAALLALCGERTHVVFGRSADAPGHMGDLLQATLAELPGARGGGSATLAQGSGPPADLATVNALLARAHAQLRQTAKPVE